MQIANQYVYVGVGEGIGHPAAVTNCPDNLNARHGYKERFQTVQNQLMIVNEQQAGGGHSRKSTKKGGWFG
ncbi:hypothetical protein GCM10027190_27730 [Spirosoma areae]